MVFIFVQGDFSLSGFGDGCLPAAFMVGLIVASPTFAYLSKHVQAFKLMGAGLLVWTLGVAACAATWSFLSILVCRMAVGVGEASFVVLAVPFIGAQLLSHICYCRAKDWKQCISFVPFSFMLRIATFERLRDESIVPMRE
jgi:MFS family permease